MYVVVQAAGFAPYRRAGVGQSIKGQIYVPKSEPWFYYFLLLLAALLLLFSFARVSV